MKKLTTILLLVAVGLLGVIAYKTLQKEVGEPLFNLGGTNPYNYEFFDTTAPVGGVIKTQFGTLNSFTITGAGSRITFYDATTTNANLRELATTSLPIIADFPLNATVGTYSLNVGFNDGLVYERSALTGTSTLAWD